jgi:hypothetical protein
MAREYVLEVDLGHISTFDELLAQMVKDRPAELLPLVSSCKVFRILTNSWMCSLKRQLNKVHNVFYMVMRIIEHYVICQIIK